jgi:hypothetical protein
MDFTVAKFAGGCNKFARFTSSSAGRCSAGPITKRLRYLISLDHLFLNQFNHFKRNKQLKKDKIR